MRSEGYSSPTIPFNVRNKGDAFVTLLHVGTGSITRAAGAYNARLDCSTAVTSMQYTQRVTDAHFLLPAACLVSWPPQVDSEWNIWKNEAMDKDYNRQVIIIKKELLDNWIDNWVDKCGQRSDRVFSLLQKP